MFFVKCAYRHYNRSVNIIITKSAEETQEVARLFARAVADELAPREKTVIIALDGALGAGKTTFAQGFAEGLGVKERVKSPTFVLLRKYDLHKHKLKAKSQKSKVKGYQYFYHADCYRLNDEKDIDAIGLREIMADPENIVLIEWARRIAKALPKKNIIRVTFKYINERTRKISFN